MEKKKYIKHICISCWLVHMYVIKINQMGGRLRYEPRLSLSFIWFLLIYCFWVLVQNLQRHLVVEIPSTRLS